MTLDVAKRDRLPCAPVSGRAAAELAAELALNDETAGTAPSRRHRIPAPSDGQLDTPSDLTTRE
jgi:hypothetical protein